ncbi:hypothetical protein [Streptomyces sp. NPDC001123]
MYETPPASAGQRRPTAGWRRISITIAAVAVIAGVSYGIGWRAGHEEDPATFTLTGHLVLNGGRGSVEAKGTGCAGEDMYADIADGTEVTVYNSEDKLVGLGKLKSSSYTEQTNTVDLGGDWGTSELVSATCSFAVTVPDVPQGERFYKVRVAHRGEVMLDAKDAEAGRLAVTLGG